MENDHIDLELTDRDLDFLVCAISASGRESSGVRKAIKHDRDYRKAVVSDRRVFFKITEDEEVFLKISPRLYFEVLLRKAQYDLESVFYTIEKSGNVKIPVFDSQEVTTFLDIPDVLEYLAHMLASFTKIHSYVVPVRIRKGIKRRVKYSDLDVDSLIKFAAKAEIPDQFRYFKRIGDLCLFLSGIYGTDMNVQADTGGRNRNNPQWVRKIERSLEDYEYEGKTFYKLAREHPTSSLLGLSEVFHKLGENFFDARKPLILLSENYIYGRQKLLFGARIS